MAGHEQVREENPGLEPKPGLCSPAPGAQRWPLVPPQALKDLKTLGCRKAMKKFEKHTLLVSGGPWRRCLRTLNKEGTPGALALESEGGNLGLQACHAPPSPA